MPYLWLVGMFYLGWHDDVAGAMQWCAAWIVACWLWSVAQPYLDLLGKIVAWQADRLAGKVSPCPVDLPGIEGYLLWQLKVRPHLGRQI